ncbi:MAG TPA: hypothetical protein VLF40_00695 [Candidatus Saccharimonadales bacterium]|nr:hypothetical protein [Candidatus Saccharimonadales bacterium]
MKTIKFASLVSGATLLAATLAPVSASALSTATISMDGVHSSNGQFSVVVYEDTGADTVTGASLALTFDQPVSNVSYDYSVGPFSAVTPSGAHNAYGTVTGRNALARVSFSIASPGTVIADVSGSSYLKHAGDTTIESFVLNLGEAYFTYDAPAPKAASSTGSTASDTPAPANDTPAPLNPAVKAASTTKKVAVVETSHTGAAVASTLSVTVVAVVAAAYWLLMRRRAAITAAVKAYRLEGTEPSKSKPASHKKK